MEKKIAVVTGANRGIGLEICRQLARNGIKVILTSRNEAKGKEAQKRLKDEGPDVDYHKLDVTDEKQIKEMEKYVSEKYGRLDILVNNAGILLDRDEETQSILDSDEYDIKKTLNTNTFGPFLICQRLIPIMKKNGYGRVVNMSSGMGQLSSMSGGYPAYRLSKTALNVVTRIFAHEFMDSNIKVNSVCPGWVRTDMGGQEAERPVEKGAETPVWLAMLPDDGPTGGFFRDKKAIEW